MASLASYIKIGDRFIITQDHQSGKYTIPKGVTGIINGPHKKDDKWDVTFDVVEADWKHKSPKKQYMQLKPLGAGDRFIITQDHQSGKYTIPKGVTGIINGPHKKDDKWDVTFDVVEADWKHKSPLKVHMEWTNTGGAGESKTNSEPASHVSTATEPTDLDGFVAAIQAKGIKLVVFDLDGVVLPCHYNKEKESYDGAHLQKPFAKDTTNQTIRHPLAPGAIALMKKLKESNIKMGMCTNNNGKYIRPILKDAVKVHQKNQLSGLTKADLWSNLWVERSKYSEDGEEVIFGHMVQPHMPHGKGKIELPDTEWAQTMNQELGHIVSGGNEPPRLVEKNAAMRLHIHRANEFLTEENKINVSSENSCGAGSTLLIEDSFRNAMAFVRMGGHCYFNKSPGTGLTDEFDLANLMSYSDANIMLSDEERQFRLQAAHLNDWSGWSSAWGQKEEGTGSYID